MHDGSPPQAPSRGTEGKGGFLPIAAAGKSSQIKELNRIDPLRKRPFGGVGIHHNHEKGGSDRELLPVFRFLSSDREPLLHPRFKNAEY